MSPSRCRLSTPRGSVPSSPSELTDREGLVARQRPRPSGSLSWRPSIRMAVVPLIPPTFVDRSRLRRPRAREPPARTGDPPADDDANDRADFCAGGPLAVGPVAVGPVAVANERADHPVVAEADAEVHNRSRVKSRILFTCAERRETAIYAVRATDPRVARSKRATRVVATTMSPAHRPHQRPSAPVPRENASHAAIGSPTA